MREFRASVGEFLGKDSATARATAATLGVDSGLLRHLFVM
ncbi:hypothetical protein SKPI104516_00885 [Skermania piniformis]